MAGRYFIVGIQTLYFLLVVAVFLPIAALAEYTENVSTSATGGASASSGEVVITGESEASSEIHTVITGGGEGGTVNVKVRTEADGVVEEKVVTEAVPPGGLNLQVSAGTSSGTARAEGTAFVSIGEGSALATSSFSWGNLTKWLPWLNVEGTAEVDVSSEDSSIMGTSPEPQEEQDETGTGGEQLGFWARFTEIFRDVFWFF